MDFNELNIYEVSEDQLMHYGRKGMKWYQNIYSKHKQNQTAKKRKKNLEKARQTREANKKAAAERAAKLKAGKLKTKDMTADELRAATERINLEKSYKAAMKDNRSKGKDFTMRVIEKIGEQTLTNMGTQAANSGLTYVGNKILDSAIKGKGMSSSDAQKLMDELKFYTNNKKKS